MPLTNPLGISPFFARRMRALGPEIPPEQDYLDMPEVDPLADPTLMESGPATKALSAHVLGGTPTHEPVGLGKGLLATLASALAGFGQNSAIAGATLGRGIIEEPYRRSVDEYNLKSKHLGDVADLEAENRRQLRLSTESRENREERRRAERERDKDRDAAREDRKLKADEAARADIQIIDDAQGNKWWANKGNQSISPMLVPQGVPSTDGTPTNPAQQFKAKVSDKVQRAAQVMDETIIQAERLKELVDKHKNTLALGPAQGGPSQVLQRQGIGATPDKADMYRIMQKIANESLYELSGAQINNKEYERLRVTLADPNSSEISIEQDLKAFLDSSYRQRKRYQDRGVWSDDAISGQGAELDSTNPGATGTDVHNVTKPERKYPIRRR